jgi:hypothetical protein
MSVSPVPTPPTPTAQPSNSFNPIESPLLFCTATQGISHDPLGFPQVQIVGPTAEIGYMEVFSTPSPQVIHNLILAFKNGPNLYFERLILHHDALVCQGDF